MTSISGFHVLGLVAIVLGGLALHATEAYTGQYQTLPVQDWLDARPPLAQAERVPPAGELAREFVRTSPLLVIREDARPLVPQLGPPSELQRTIGGLRDAARIELGAPGAFPPGDVPVRARLDVLVFNRAERAAAWTDLLAHAFDVQEPERNFPQVRLSGPDQADRVFLTDPRNGGGVATVIGHRGPVGFQLQTTFQRGDSRLPADRVDLDARAEPLARQMAADWARWLEGALTAAS